MSNNFICNQDVTLTYDIDPLISEITITPILLSSVLATKVLPVKSESFISIGFNIIGLILTDGYAQAPIPVPGVIVGNSVNNISNNQSLVLDNAEVSVIVPVILPGSPPQTKNHTVKVIIDNPGQDKVIEI